MTKPELNHLYLCIAFWFALIGLLLRLGCLAWMDYPRSLRYSRGEDAFYIVFGTVTMLFVWWLAWG